VETSLNSQTDVYVLVNSWMKSALPPPPDPWWMSSWQSEETSSRLLVNKHWQRWNNTVKICVFSVDCVLCVSSWRLLRLYSTATISSDDCTAACEVVCSILHDVKKFGRGQYPCFQCVCVCVCNFCRQWHQRQWSTMVTVGEISNWLQCPGILPLILYRLLHYGKKLSPWRADVFLDKSKLTKLAEFAWWRRSWSEWSRIMSVRMHLRASIINWNVYTCVQMWITLCFVWAIFTGDSIHLDHAQHRRLSGLSLIFASREQVMDYCIARLVCIRHGILPGFPELSWLEPFQD
jgi:hypothetical protein